MIKVILAAVSIVLAGTLAVNAAQCPDIDDLSAAHKPPKLAQMTRDCIAGGNYRRAMQVFFAFSAQGLFDQQRVADESAHVVLSEARTFMFGGWGADVLDELRTVANDMKDPNSETLRSICQILRRNGPPSYRPGYMIIRGMIPRRSAEDWVVPEFDGQKAWRRSLNDLNGCPEE